jgi:hypothetical protein
MLLNVLLFVLSVLLVAAAVTQHVFRRLIHVVPTRLTLFLAFCLSFWAVLRINCRLLAGRVEGIWCLEGRVLTGMSVLVIVAAIGLLAALIHRQWRQHIETRRRLDPFAYISI